MSDDLKDQSDISDKRPQAEGAQKPERDAPEEVGGPEGPEPTRFGDWEHKGRCFDF